MLLAIGVNVANVIARYVFSSAIFWTEEILVFLMLWTIFVAAISVAFNGDHINMDLVYERFSRRWKLAISVAVATAFVCAAAFVAVQSWEVVVLHHQNGTVSVAAGVPMIVPHSALLVGFGLMALAAAYRVVITLRTPDNHASRPL
jgi:TRAP-type C4-dicarboxylate transport system permease small subunit